MEIGAQIWLNSSDSYGHVEKQFVQLEQLKMPVTRIFIMWNYIEQKDGSNDYKVYDYAFKAARIHKVKIVATLMPNFGPPHKGFLYKSQDGAIPKDTHALQDGLAFVRRTVARYRDSVALDSWMLMNEPGQMPTDDAWALSRFRSYLLVKYKKIDSLNSAWISNFSSFDQVSYSSTWAGGGWTWPTSYIDWNTFWREHLTHYLEAVSNQIMAIDSTHGIHINPHALLDIPHRYQLSSWKKFLTSLGASVHPVWHFNILDRPDFTMGLSYVASMIRNAANPKPFWITELQGGHNMYTAKFAMIPKEHEIEAWLLSSAFAGAKRTIFWCLNPRPQGTEGGEWAMQDLQGRPTARLLKASSIANLLADDSIFKNLQPKSSKVVLLQSATSRFVQERSNVTEPVYRSKSAHQLALLGCYKALQCYGVCPEIMFTDDARLTTDFSDGGKVFILPHATALSDREVQTLKALTNQNNHLIITGVTGFYDENEKVRAVGDTSFQNLVGGAIQEYYPPETEKPKQPHINLGNISIPVSGYLGRVKITSNMANALVSKGQATGIRNRLQRSQVIWVPANIDIGAFSNDAIPLGKWLLNTINELLPTNEDAVTKLSVPGVVIQLANSNNREFVLMINSRKEVKTIVLQRPVKATYYGKGFRGKAVNSVVLPGNSSTVVELKKR